MAAAIAQQLKFAWNLGLMCLIHTPPLSSAACFQPLSRASMSAGGLEAAAASGGGDDEGGLRHHKQQQHDADIKDEILAHLRLVGGLEARGAGCGGVVQTARCTHKRCSLDTPKSRLWMRAAPDQQIALPLSHDMLPFLYKTYAECFTKQLLVVTYDCLLTFIMLFLQAAAFRPRARDSPNSSLPHPCTPPAAGPAAPGPSAAAASSAAAVASAAAGPPAAPATGGAGEAMPHGVSLVDWVGKYIGAQPVSAAPTGSSVEEIDTDKARLQLLCGGVLGEAAAAAGPPASSSVSAAADGSGPGKAAGNSPQSKPAAAAGAAGEEAAGTATPTAAAAVPPSPKAMSKSAQLYQQLLLRSHGSAAGSSPKGSSGGGSSSAGRSRQGSKGGGSSSQSQPGGGAHQARGARSPVKARASISAGNEQQQQQVLAAGEPVGAAICNYMVSLSCCSECTCSCDLQCKGAVVAYLCAWAACMSSPLCWLFCHSLIESIKLTASIPVCSPCCHACRCCSAAVSVARQAMAGAAAARGSDRA